MVSMLEEKVTDCTKVSESDINNCLKVSRLSFRLEIGAQICLVDHELVLWCGHNSCSILSLSDEVLHHLEQVLLLQRCDLGTHHHVGDVSKGDERLDHCLIPHDFSQSLSCENYNVPVVLDLVLHEDLVISLFVLKQFLYLVSQILLSL